MRTPNRRSSIPALAAGLVILACLAGTPPRVAATDYNDGTGKPKGPNARLDLLDLYSFDSPANNDNTVIIVTLSPFAGVLTPTTFRSDAVFEIRVYESSFTQPAVLFQIAFSDPAADGTQTYQMRRQPGNALISFGPTNTNRAVMGGGLFRAGLQDDPSFVDLTALRKFLKTGKPNSFRNPPRNYFGPNANVLALVLEIPDDGLTDDSFGDIDIDASVRITGTSTSFDRVGEPGTNLMLIPKAKRVAFNRGAPAADKASFEQTIFQTLTRRPYRRDDTTAMNLAGAALPDVQRSIVGDVIDSSGRTLRDDWIDLRLFFYTGGAVTTDFLSDDNGTRITDGTGGTIAAFPYVGGPNVPAQGPNP